MAKFGIGEEVRYDGEVYMISARLGEPSRPLYRLLASRRDGTHFVVAPEDQLQRMESYLNVRNDTGNY